MTGSGNLTSPSPKVGTDLTGRRAVVTGAGRNVGEAIAVRLAEAGASIATVDIDGSKAEAIAKRINDIRAGAATPVVCDVSSSASVRTMVDRVSAALGGVDILVNNVAATDRGHTVLDLEEDEWDRVMNVTAKSVFLCTRYVAPIMVSQGRGGNVVNIGSTSGYKPRTNALAYPTAKAAVYALTKSAAVQLGRHGIRVNTVSPNKVGSPVGEELEPEHRERANLLGRACTPDDIAKAVHFIVSPDAGFVTGTDLLVDGGAFLVGGV